MMEWVSGNVFIRANQPAKGVASPGHTHNFDHTTIVFKGAVHVSATLPNGTVIERDFYAPTHFLVRRDVLHEITALEDGTVYWCVYSHRNPQGDVVQEWDGWREATV
jgi:hypothetical protein